MKNIKISYVIKDMDIWKSDKYWDVMNYLASPKFNAQKMCASLQHKVNEALDNVMEKLNKETLLSI